MTDRLADWVTLVDARYPERDAASWDASGLQLGAPDDRIERVLVCLDVTDATLDEARAQGVQLVLAHHPLLFRPLERLTPASAAGRLLLRAAREGLAVLGAHTNLDAAVPGTTDPVARLLRLVGVRPLVPLADAADDTTDDTRGEDAADRPKGIGLVGALPAPRSLAAIAAVLAEGLPSPHLRLAGDPERQVQTIAACGGAGDAHIADALAAGADVYVTGDLRHHPTLDALTMGLALIDAGHYRTEAAALPGVLVRLAADAQRAGLSAELVLSGVVTEPWEAFAPPPR